MTASMEYGLLYLEVNIASLLLLGIIRYKTRTLTSMMAHRLFARALKAEALFFASDTLFVMMTSGLMPYNRVVALACKELYFFSTCLICFLWFIFFECIQGTPYSKNKKSMALSVFLLCVLTFLLAINLFNGMFFYIDGDNVYHRGPLFVVQYIISYVYVVAAGVRLMWNIKGRDDKNAKALRTMVIFPLLPAIAGIVQFIFPRLPLACVTLALLSLALYLALMDQIISLDPLTMLNNRKQFNDFYENISRSEHDLSGFYMMIIDVDKFKGINDKYGHVVGDEALRRIAEALKKSIGALPNRSNIARFGGDEFIAVVESGSREVMEELKVSINETIKEMNEEAKAPYNLTVSIGITGLRKNASLEELISEADREMYTDKRKR